MKSKAVILMGVVFTGVLPILATAAVYVDPNNELIVADTAAYESEPRVSGSTVTWCSSPAIGKDDIYYRMLPSGWLLPACRSCILAEKGLIRVLNLQQNLQQFGALIGYCCGTVAIRSPS